MPNLRANMMILKCFCGTQCQGQVRRLESRGGVHLPEERMDSLNVPRLQHVQEGRQRKIPHAFFHTGTRRNEIMLPVYEMSRRMNNVASVSGRMGEKAIFNAAGICGRPRSKRLRNKRSG